MLAFWTHSATSKPNNYNCKRSVCLLWARRRACIVWLNAYMTVRLTNCHEHFFVHRMLMECFIIINSIIDSALPRNIVDVDCSICKNKCLSCSATGEDRVKGSAARSRTNNFALHQTWQSQSEIDGQKTNTCERVMFFLSHLSSAISAEVHKEMSAWCALQSGQSVRSHVLLSFFVSFSFFCVCILCLLTPFLVMNTLECLLMNIRIVRK